MLKTISTCIGAMTAIVLISGCSSNSSKKPETPLMKIAAYPETRKEEQSLDFSEQQYRILICGLKTTLVLKPALG